MSLGSIILAAGASKRMGRPKALLEWRGETFLDCLISAHALVCSPVVVVVGGDAGQIRAGSKRSGEARFVVNEDPERGQLSSLQCGLRALPEDVEGCLFTPVDCPRVRPETLIGIVAAWEAGRPQTLLAVPRFANRRGHPVCCAREVFDDFLNLPAGATARDVLRRYSDCTAYIETGDAGVAEDVDTPEDYAGLEAVSGV